MSSNTPTGEWDENGKFVPYPKFTTTGLTFPIGTTLAEVEKSMIEATLVHTKGDKLAAAKLLGISSRTIYRKIAEKDVK